MPVSSVYSPWAYISGKSLVAMVITTDKHTYVNQSQLHCKQLEFYIWFIEIIALKQGWLSTPATVLVVLIYASALAVTKRVEQGLNI